jgi:hypothetical protein
VLPTGAGAEVGMEPTAAADALLEVHELLVLLPHHVCWDVVGVGSITEFSPRHLVVRGASGGVVQPPCAGITTQLLRGKESLLHLWFSARSRTWTLSP